LLGCETDEFVEEIKEKLKKFPRLRSEIKNLLNNYDNDEKKEMFLKYLYESSLSFIRGSKGNNFEDHLLALKNFCTYLYLKGGYGLYESLYLNAPIPSTATIKKGIQNDRMEPCRIYAQELDNFLIKNKLPKHVIIAEDATRVLDRIEFDPQTNELYGLLAPTDETTGMPIANFFKVTKPSMMKHYIENYKIAPYIQVIVAKALELGKYQNTIFFFVHNSGVTRRARAELKIFCRETRPSWLRYWFTKNNE